MLLLLLLTLLLVAVGAGALGPSCSPGLDLVTQPLQLLDLLLQVGLKLLLLVDILGVMHLQQAQGVAAGWCGLLPAGTAARGWCWRDTGASMRPAGPTFCQIWSNSSIPSCTFLSVRSISLCSLRAAPILH